MSSVRIFVAATSIMLLAWLTTSFITDFSPEKGNTQPAATSNAMTSELPESMPNSEEASLPLAKVK